MNPDEYVDRLIERRERREQPLPVSTDEVAASLAAAEVLTQLREIAIPPEFAGSLELYIRARARSFGQQTSTALPVVRPGSRAGVRRSWTAALPGFTAPQQAFALQVHQVRGQGAARAEFVLGDEHIVTHHADQRPQHALDRLQQCILAVTSFLPVEDGEEVMHGGADDAVP